MVERFIRGLPGVVMGLVMGIGVLAVDSLAQVRTALIPSLTVSEEFNDNIFFRERDREADLVTRIIPRIDLFVPRPRTEVSVSFQPGVEFLARHPEETRQLQALNFNLFHRVSPLLDISVTDTFSLAPTTFQEVIPELGVVRVERTRVITNSLSVVAGYRFTPKTSANGILGYSLSRFQARRLIDSDALSLRGGVTHRLTPRTTLNGALRFQNLRFEEGESVSTVSLQLGGSHQITRVWSTSASLGITLAEGELGAFIAATLTRIFATGSLNFGFDRDITAGGGLLGLITGQRFSIGWNQAVTRRLSWNALFSLSTSSPRGREIEFFFVQAGTGLAYLVSRRVTLSASYNFGFRDRRGPGGEIFDNRLRITLTITFPPIR